MRRISAAPAGRIAVIDHDLAFDARAGGQHLVDQEIVVGGRDVAVTIA